MRFDLIFEQVRKYRHHFSLQLNLKGLRPQNLAHKNYLKFEERMQHLTWLCDEILMGHLEGEKLHRCLGFIQGVLWQMGYYSVHDFKSHNVTPQEMLAIKMEE